MGRIEGEISSPDLPSEVDARIASERETFRTLSAPVTAQWELTPFCNERCVHCYNFWRKDNQGGKLEVTSDTIGIYDRTSREIVDNKVFHVTATGGEPLAVLKQVSPYLQRLTENGISVSLNTNLTMLNKEKAVLLKGLGIKSVLTSLISYDPYLNDELANRPNTHRDVSSGVKLALDEGFWVGVNMVVSKKNLDGIYATAEYVKGLGVRDFSATKASTPTSSENFKGYALSQEEVRFMMKELLRVRDDLGLTVDSLEFYPMCLFDTREARDFAANHACNAGKTGCTIGFDGFVRPCSHASQIYGSIQDKGGLSEAWKNLRPWRTNVFVPAKCIDCSYEDVCRGGCRSEAFVVNGSLDAPDPYCDYDRVVLPKTPSPEINIDLSSLFEFRPSVKSRKEDFGGILFAAPAKWAGITKELLDFFQKNRSYPFTLQDLSVNLGLDSIETTIQTVAFLKQKAIVQERR